MKNILNKAVFGTFLLTAVLAQDTFAQKTTPAAQEAGKAFGTVFGDLIKSNLESLGMQFDRKTLDQKAFLDALQKSINGRPVMDSKAAQDFVNKNINDLQEKKSNEAAAAGKDFLATNRAKSTVKTTDSGLQ